MFKWLQGKKKEILLTAPMTGTLLAVEAIPDQVFSAKMVGDGFAVAPETGQVLAPCAGKITQIFPTSHAIGIETPEGLEILIHIGIDTVELKGEGFTRLAAAGDTVETGTPLLAVELETLTAGGKSLVTPVIITNMEKVESIQAEPVTHVTAGVTPVVRIILK